MGRIFRRAMTIVAVLTIVALVGCGGGGGGEDTAGTASAVTSTSEGPIAGFGSIIMNGDRWETSSADVDVEGVPGSQSDLAVGMVVRIEGSKSNGRARARRVIFAPRLVGPIRSIEELSPDARALEILGRRAIVSRTSTHFRDTTLDDLEVDDLVLVSGLVNEADELEATFLRDRGDAIVGESRVRTFGTVEGLSGGSFMIGTSEILFDGDTELEDLGEDGLSEGDVVRVRGILLANDAIDASHIKGREDDDDDDMDEVEIQGIVSDYVSIADFKVGDRQVDASGARLMPNDPTLLRDGVLVEAEGRCREDGVLVATKLKFRSHRVRIHAEVAFDDDVDPINRELTLLGIPITVDDGARLRDRRDRIDGFDLEDIVAGDFLEVRGIARPDGSVIAAHVHRDRFGDIRLKGPVTTIDRDAYEIGVLGLVIPTSSRTEFEMEDGARLSRDAFFDRVEAGWKVHVRDREDGDETSIDVADSVELEAPELEDDDEDESPDPDDEDDDDDSDDSDDDDSSDDD